MDVGTSARMNANVRVIESAAAVNEETVPSGANVVNARIAPHARSIEVPAGVEAVMVTEAVGAAGAAGAVAAAERDKATV